MYLLLRYNIMYMVHRWTDLTLYICLFSKELVELYLFVLNIPLNLLKSAKTTNFKIQKQIKIGEITK